MHCVRHTTASACLPEGLGGESRWDHRKEDLLWMPLTLHAREKQPNPLVCCAHRPGYQAGTHSMKAKYGNRAPQLLFCPQFSPHSTPHMHHHRKRPCTLNSHHRITLLTNQHTTSAHTTMVLSSPHMLWAALPSLLWAGLQQQLLAHKQPFVSLSASVH